MREIILILCATLTFSVTVNAQQTWNIGYPNEGDITATLVDNTLTISGTGATKDYTNAPPWWRQPIKTLVFEGEITRLGNNLFSDIELEGELTLPNTLIFIGINVFRGYSKLSGELRIPDNVVEIGNSAFSGCSGFSKLILPAGLKSIGNFAFENCIGFEGELIIPNGITDIPWGAFVGCSGFTSLTIPNSVISIGYATFRRCSGLTGTLILPVGLTTIQQSFDECSNLNSIVIPCNVTTIAAWAFSNCSSLNSITNHSPIPLPIQSNVFQNVNISACTLFVSNASVEQYKKKAVWSDFGAIIGNGISIAAYPNHSQLGTIGGLTNKFYTNGERVTLTATPVTPELNIFWTTSDGEIVSTNAIYSFDATQDVVLYANFENVEELTLTEAGTLKDKISNKSTISKLILSGLIDARDIQFIRDSLPILIELDLSETSIVEYSGAEGTNYGNYTYSADKMPPYSFRENNHIKLVILPNSLSVIESYAFTNSYVSSVTLPRNLSSIERFAFGGSFALSKIINLNPNPISFTEDRSMVYFEGVNIDYCTLIVPSSSLEAYQAAPIWEEFNIIAANDMTTTLNEIKEKSSLNIYSARNEIFIENVQGEHIIMYNTKGQLVESARNVNGTFKTVVPQAGVYIVRVGKENLKVVVAN